MMSRHIDLDSDDSVSFITLEPNVSIQDTAYAMEAAGVDCVPVVDPKGSILGIFTQHDILKGVSDFRDKHKREVGMNESESPFEFLREGTLKYQTPRAAEYLGQRIANVCPNPKKAKGISEIMLNSVEHGNLGITYDEKTNLINLNILSDEIRRRLTLDKNKDKYVEVHFKRLPQKLEVIIDDRGEGFDYNKYLVFDQKRVFDNHGRGIAMAALEVNLEYVNEGRQVKITVPFYE